MASDKTLQKDDIESLKLKINELNQLVSLQQYYIDEWREKYEDEKRNTQQLKNEIKSKQILEQESMSLKNKIKKQNEIINSKNKRIYHLQNPMKWQWCDFAGYIWREFDQTLSEKIESSYQNNKDSYRYIINSTQSEQHKNKHNDIIYCAESRVQDPSKGKLYHFEFNKNLQNIDNNKYLSTEKQYRNSNEEKQRNDQKTHEYCHKMILYASTPAPLHYFIQRIPMNFKTICYMNPMMWSGPARNTNGDSIMILYHVTDKSAANIICKSRTMKCGANGRFGGGIYFAEKVTTAQGRAHHTGYVITARVLVGKELIIKKDDSGQFRRFDFAKLQRKGFDSVYAEYMTERVVYNSDQICVVDIKKMSLFKFFSE